MIIALSILYASMPLALLTKAATSYSHTSNGEIK